MKKSIINIDFFMILLIIAAFMFLGKFFRDFLLYVGLCSVLLLICYGVYLNVKSNR